MIPLHHHHLVPSTIRPLTYGTFPPKPLNSLPSGTGSAPLPYGSHLAAAFAAGAGAASLSLSSSHSANLSAGCTAENDDAAVDAGGAGDANDVLVPMIHSQAAVMSPGERFFGRRGAKSLMSTLAARTCVQKEVAERGS